MVRRMVLVVPALLFAWVALLSGCGGESDGPNGPSDPVCELGVEVLSFGSVAVGETSDLTFKITNAGGGTLSGTVTVSEGCPDFSIAGEAGYSLGAGDTAAITVRFAPATAGAKASTLDTGASQCPGLPCTGTGVAVTPICQVSPTSLNFFNIYIGHFYDRTFTITNVGGGTLSGSVGFSESPDDYSIESGGGAYNLTAGQSDTVTVRFTPTLVGAKTCTIATGANCASVACTGVGDTEPLCDLSVSELDFGTVLVGSYKDTTFSVTNIGGGILVGEVYIESAGFSVVGASEFALSAGHEATFTIGFAPASVGPAQGTIYMDSEFCEGITCIGVGAEAPPVCELSTTSLDFGELLVGTSRDYTFTITNTGGGTLSGRVSESCDDFSIVSGGGDYTLAADQQVTVTIKFAPVLPGEKTCAVSTGSSCPSVFCSGEGAPPPVCNLSASILDFGKVMVGAEKDLTFTITNAGGWWLDGLVEPTCDDFSIVEFPEYWVGAGGSVTFTARFSPWEVGSFDCVIELYSDYCADITCTGEGVGGPTCDVDPDTLGFGLVGVGDNVDRSFTIKNTVGGTLSGTVWSPCAEFSIVGNATYSLAHGDSASFTVRFAPSDVGAEGCEIETGSEVCSDVTATGAGAPQADYYVDASSGLDSNPGTLQAPFKTVTHAVAAAGPDKTIFIGPGTYGAAIGEAFPIVVQSGQSLLGDVANKGAGAAPTVICGAGYAGNLPWSEILATLVAADGSSIAGLELDAPESYTSFGVYLKDVTSSIADNTFGSAALDLYGGVCAMGSGTSSVADNDFMTNSYGVYNYQHTGAMTVESNFFATMAICVDIAGYLDSTSVRGNTFVGSGQCGMQVQSGAPLVENNTFNNPGGYPVYGAVTCGGSDATPVVRGNTFTCARGVYNESGNPDLGTVGNPGGNDFSSVPGAAVYHMGTSAISAIGNTWANQPPVCGTDIALAGTGTVIWGEGAGESCP